MANEHDKNAPIDETLAEAKARLAATMTRPIRSQDYSTLRKARNDAALKYIGAPEDAEQEGFVYEAPEPEPEPKPVLSAKERDALIREACRTPEGRAKIAASMISPRRCGGRDYVDGKAYMRTGGCLVPVDIWHQGIEATLAYLKTCESAPRKVL